MNAIFISKTRKNERICLSYSWNNVPDSRAGEGLLESGEDTLLHVQHPDRVVGVRTEAAHATLLEPKRQCVRTKRLFERVWPDAVILRLQNSDRADLNGNKKKLLYMFSTQSKNLQKRYFNEKCRSI